MPKILNTQHSTLNTQLSVGRLSVSLWKKHTASMLAKLKHLLIFGALTLSLNVTSAGDIQSFDKAAYLDLNQNYANDYQAINTKEENAKIGFFKEILGSVRNALGSTNSDNTDQLGAKITSDLKAKLENKLEDSTIGEAQRLINAKANEFANSFGNGRTEISIHKIDSNKPTYSINTIQPLTELNEDSTALTFVQAQLNSSENYDERRKTINLGIGYRALLEGGQSIAGINLFTDYETESRHKRASIGLEYQRANFTANVNKYYPLSDKVVIGDYTEEPLSGYDVRLTGQVPYLSWAKIKATRYQWDATDNIVSKDISGTILGFEVALTPSTTIEFGSENNNDEGITSASYVRLTTDLQGKGGGTNFAIAHQAFSNSNIVTLTDLDRVERSNKIRVERLRVERLLNGTTITAGVYNATTVGAVCTLYNASGVAVANGSGITGASGTIDLSSVVMPAGLASMTCVGGSYTDEATGQVVDPAPTIRAAKIYSGTGDFIILASPLSETAYQLAENSGDLAGSIEAQNDLVSTAFGLGIIDITSTIPTDLNNESAANDDAGKFGLILAAVSQLVENLNAGGGQAPTAAETTSLIAKLVIDTKGDNSRSDVIDDIDGVDDDAGTKVDISRAISNFEDGAGNNNDGVANANAGAAGSATGEGSVKGNLAIIKISHYDGTDPTPSVEDYIDAGVNGVTSANLTAINALIDPAIIADTDTTVEIQAIVDDANAAASPTNINTVVTASASVVADGVSTASITVTLADTNGNLLTSSGGVVVISGSGSSTISSVTDNSNGSYSATATNTTAQSVTYSATLDGVTISSTADTIFTAAFSIDAIANTSVVENSVFTGPTPSISGNPVGALTYTLGGNDAADFTINSATGVISMIARDFEIPVDADTNNTYAVTIIATDANSNTDSEGLIVTVTDVVEEPVVLSVVIGTQTWAANNANSVPDDGELGTDYWTDYTGTDGSGSASDNDGYFYTWDAAMNGATAPGAQGVCASGWHVPSDADWAVLEEAVVAGASGINWLGTTGWRGTTEGTQLKVGGTSGFDAKLAGYRNTNGSFHGRGDYANLWSSTQADGEAYSRYLHTSKAIVYRNTDYKAFGFSVRCLKD